MTAMKKASWAALTWASPEVVDPVLVVWIGVGVTVWARRLPGMTDKKIMTKVMTTDLCLLKPFNLNIFLSSFHYIPLYRNFGESGAKNP